MPYVPKKRRFHLTWKMGIVFVCIAVGIAALVFWRMDHSEVQGEFHACEFTNSQMRDLEQQSTQTIELEDYLFYGETLSLYMDPYDGEEDEIYGKTMELVNICSGEQYNFTVGNTADRQIFLPDLSDGTYEIYLIDSFQRKRVIFADTVYSDAFQTMRRNGKVKEATLIADRSALDAYGGSLSANYAFLNVETVTPDADKADVLIDPFGLYTTVWGGIDVGFNDNGIVEYEESYEVAMAMKAQLESYGLKVLISRDKEEVVEYYGENSRASKGYEADANYLIGIGFTYGSGHAGIETYHGIQSSTHLTNDILYCLLQNYGIEGSQTYTSQTSVHGVFSSSAVEGDDGRTVYDGMPVFRESGGKATLTGQYNERSAANQIYAQENGMQGIELDLACLSDEEDTQFYKDNKETIIRGLSEGFINALDVE